MPKASPHAEFNRVLRAEADGPLQWGIPTRSEVAAREHLTCLAYELLDAHDDTARLAAELSLDPRWHVHLDYLRDLQRIGRETLAHAACGEIR